MSDTQKTCSRCEGCGQIANDDDGTPWKYWENLPEESKAAIRCGIVRPRDCPDCGGTGKVDAAWAGKESP